MIVELGTFCLSLALALSLAQALVVAYDIFKPKSSLAELSQGLALGAALTTLLAFLSLIYAFVCSDFSVANVEQYSHTLKPLLYKISGAWASHEGSMLLWCTILTGYGAMVVLFGGNLPGNLKHKVLAVQGGLGVAFIAFTLLTSNPLARLDSVPVEGRSLNPLLQDPALAFHPPMLYLGYVGFSIVFSFALAALMQGRIDRAWARWVRPWTLLAWCFLTIGITLGAFWAYYELGWGGWWFWDPVENASFMPWLAGTALLHSAIVMEKREALKSWTVFLAILAFTFAMMGAFLVRSGVLSSVHAFAVDPRRGIFLLIILFIVSGFGFGLYGWRAPSLKAGSLFAPISREAGLVVNNILLTSALGTVFLGTLYPLLIEAFGGKTISVGAPYFLLTFAPIMGAAVLLLPFAIAMSWKRSEILGIGQRLMAVMALSIVCAGLSLWGRLGHSPTSLLSFAIGLIMGFWLVLSSIKSVMDRVNIAKTGALKRFYGLPLAFMGMNLAHIGLGVFILGAVFETHAKTSNVEALKIGQSLSLSGYSVTLNTITPVKGPNYQALRAQLIVTNAKGKTVCMPTPERRFYPASKSTTSEVALCLMALNDLYFVLGEAQKNDDGQPVWQVRALFNPWIRLVFLGPMFMLLGGVLSLLDRHLRLGVVTKGLAAKKPSKTIDIIS